MQVASTTTDEAQRTAALDEFGILDTPTKALFDAFALTLDEAQRTMFEELARTVAGRVAARVGMLSTALGATTDAVAISTLSEGLDTETYIYANDAFLRLKGAAGPDVIGQRTSRFHGPLTDFATLDDVRARLLRGEPFRGAYVTYKLDGTHYFADVAAYALTGERGTTTHMLTVQRDVTAAVLHDSHLALQTERLIALTSIAGGIFAALEPRALVDALVAGARDLIGGEARLLVALPNGGFAETHDLRPDDARAEADPALEPAANENVPLITGDGRRGLVRITGSLGETRYLLDVRSPEPLQAADVFGLSLLAQYVAVAARNVELYGELQTRRAAVVELNQVKNDLIAMLAHDFKGPLTTIVGFADVLSENDRFDDESRKFLAMISSSAMRLASLATDTLALSRLEQNELELNVEEFDLVALVADIVRVFRVTRSIDLSCDRTEHLICGDPARLRQVFENLIGNAIKYSPNGDPVAVDLRSKGRGVEVTVRDHGIGIPAADQGKLFGRFARAQNARAMGIGGTGFGLYLTKTILEMHGGAIAFETREGHGSTFRAFVPATVAVTRPQHRRFLLLDPAGDARSYVAHTLRDDGYAATVVEDGAAALAQVDDMQFDAALIDTERVGMPLEEFVRRIAGRTALIRIDAAAVAETAGWDGALVRPFLTQDLHAAIESATRRHPRRKPPAVLSFSPS